MTVCLEHTVEWKCRTVFSKLLLGFDSYTQKKFAKHRSIFPMYRIVANAIHETYNAVHIESIPMCPSSRRPVASQFLCLSSYLALFSGPAAKSVHFNSSSSAQRPPESQNNMCISWLSLGMRCGTRIPLKAGIESDRSEIYFFDIYVSYMIC